MHHAPGLSAWAGLPLDASPWWVLIVVVLLWSVVSVLLVAGLGAWVATKRSWRERR
jgi:hypothetical protein